MTTPPASPVRIPARVAEHVLSSDAAYTSGRDPLAERLARRIKWTTPRKDGSRLITLTEDEAGALLDYAEGLFTAAKDSAGRDGDMESLADLNSARSVIRALTPNDPEVPAPRTAPAVRLLSTATEPADADGLCSYNCGSDRRPDLCRMPAAHPLPHWSRSGR